MTSGFHLLATLGASCTRATAGAARGVGGRRWRRKRLPDWPYTKWQTQQGRGADPSPTPRRRNGRMTLSVGVLGATPTAPRLRARRLRRWMRATSRSCRRESRTPRSRADISTPLRPTASQWPETRSSSPSTCWNSSAQINNVSQTSGWSAPGTDFVVAPPDLALQRSTHGTAWTSEHVRDVALDVPPVPRAERLPHHLHVLLRHRLLRQPHGCEGCAASHVDQAHDLALL